MDTTTCEQLPSVFLDSCEAPPVSTAPAPAPAPQPAPPEHTIENIPGPMCLDGTGEEQPTAPFFPEWDPAITDPFLELYDKGKGLFELMEEGPTLDGPGVPFDENIIHNMMYGDEPEGA